MFRQLPPARLSRPSFAVVALVALAGAGALPTKEIAFRESAVEVGIDFTHFNGMSGALYLAEIMGAGVALFDFDNDGRLDVFFVQGTMLGEVEIGAASLPPKHPQPLTHRLYRNEPTVLVDGTRQLRFKDVTETARLPPAGYGMGVAAGDFNNDGNVDLYVTQLGSNQLLRNNGDGTFSDVTQAAGVDDFRWSVPAVFFDYDRDGWLDLYVGNYVDFRPANQHPCTGRTGAPDYCGPDSYNPEPDRLFRNRGDGTFEDVTAHAGLNEAHGAALGAVASDFDANGWLDLYVANDKMPNQLWLNQGDGTFTESSLLAGVAVNREGIPEASMGVVAQDFDGTGTPDLFLTHLDGETNTLYLNDGRGLFEDRSTDSNLGVPSFPFTGFGVGQADFNGDGWLDLFVANGKVRIDESQLTAGDPLPLRQPDHLYLGSGGGRFSRVDSFVEGGKIPVEVGRGVAAGDLDADGLPDLIVTNNAGPARLYLNQGESRSDWWGMDLVTGNPPRPALGARVSVVRQGQPPIRRYVGSDGSYASAGDPRVLMTSVPLDEVLKIEVWWPSGRSETFSSLTASRYNRLTEGEGESSDSGGRESVEE